MFAESFGNFVGRVPIAPPAGLTKYSADLIAGLSSRALIRIEFDGETAREAERYDMGRRMRAVVQGPAGAIWMLEDRSSGRLLKLVPSH